MFEKFTERARKVLSLARQEAQAMNSEFIGTEHMLLAIIREGGGTAARVLKEFKVNPRILREKVVETLTPSSSPTVTIGQLPFSPRAKRVLELAGESAAQLGHDVIGTEHLLLGLLKENEGIAAQVLVNMGVKFDEVRDLTLKLLGQDSAPTLGKEDDFYEVCVYTEGSGALRFKLIEKPEITFRSSDGRVKIEWKEGGRRETLYISPLQTFRLSEPEKKAKEEKAGEVLWPEEAKNPKKEGEAEKS